MEFNLTKYIKENITNIILSLVILIIIIFFMVITKTNAIVKFTTTIGFLVIIILNLFNGYFKRKNFYGESLGEINSLDKKYLISEIIKPPNFLDGRVLYYMLKESNKSMCENVNSYKFSEEEYREYIEMWIHEIKIPISSIKLIVENNKNELTSNVEEEVEKIEKYIEQALFYARSNNIEKDYIISEIGLDDLVKKVIKKNSKLFIQNKISLSVDKLNYKLYTDSKWVEFILNQILSNSIKYRRENSPSISIYSKDVDNNIVLTIKDNGIGISPEDLGRVFDKGFTGYIGREDNKSTGIGLYLSKKMCKKLGLNISIESKVNMGTKVNIVFPRGKMTMFK